MPASQDRKRIHEYIAEQHLMAVVALDERISNSAVKFFYACYYKFMLLFHRIMLIFRGVWRQVNRKKHRSL